MYIRRIAKKDKDSDKTYTYYRLVHAYKVGKKVRQQNILNLGKLEDVPQESHKLLANRIEEIITGTVSLFSDVPDDLEKQAQHFASRIINKGVFPVKKKKRTVSQELPEDYQEVDMNSMEQLESKSIGGEWLVKQAFYEFEIEGLFKDTGLTNKEIVIAEQLLASKMLHPSSELETERWLKENSGVSELYPTDDDRPVSRYRLYKAALHLYKHKDDIEKYLYSKTYDMFSGRSQIVVYDLTNMYFEGQMKSSKKARFGRSKEKRTDCRLIGLALAIDSLGFVRYSKTYSGNIGEPTTFEQMLDDVAKQFSPNTDTPMVIMDAGIATEDKLKVLKKRKYDYVCVSRSFPSGYLSLTENTTRLEDDRGHKIEVNKIWAEDKQEVFLHIKSERKQLKEESMDEKISQRFLERMEYLKEGLLIPRRTKKITVAHKTAGRIKDQYSKVALTDKQIWDMYNLTREVEACFRFLKTDLNIRPIHHQKDEYIEPHIWLVIVAYQIAHYIRLKLKEKGIKYSWKTIAEKMQSQQVSIVSLNKKGYEKIYTKLITRPSVEIVARWY